MNNSEVEGEKVQFAIMSIFERSQDGNLSRPSKCVCVCECVFNRHTADSVGMGEGDPSLPLLPVSPPDIDPSCPTQI